MYKMRFFLDAYYICIYGRDYLALNFPSYRQPRFLESKQKNGWREYSIMALSNISTQDEESHAIQERPSKHAHDSHDLLTSAQEKFAQRNPRSLELHQNAVKSLPGGNTRSLLHTAPFPLCMKSGKGYQVTDEDGHT
jgi:hypothetical protein